MKIKLLTLTFILTLLLSCMPSAPKLKLLQSKDIQVEVTISEVGVYKYSRVTGYFTYGGFRYYITNGNNGYYYKKYNLKNGDRVTTTIRMNWYEARQGVLVTYSNLELNQYIIK